MQMDRFVQSRPHPVFWAGFKSNTFALQQAGWEFSASQAPELDGVGLMMRHRGLGMVASTNLVPMMHFYQSGYAMHDPNAIQPFHVQWLTDRNPQFQYINPPDYLEYCQPVDMKPQLMQQSEVRTLDDMNIFANVCMARTTELIVDPDDVSAMMDRILELQDPARQERFKRMVQEQKDPGRVRSDPMPRQQFHAQIVSIAA